MSGTWTLSEDGTHWITPEGDRVEIADLHPMTRRFMRALAEQGVADVIPETEAPGMQVYLIEELVDRESYNDTWRSDPEEHGVYLRRELAEQEVERLNQADRDRYAERQEAEYQQRLAQFHRAQAEHQALVTAGLRHREHLLTGSEPVRYHGQWADHYRLAGPFEVHE